ncbi:MAG: hypothetical protein PHI97_13920 [Desulfobulbus sp.]|nr:hypothetical protein [Desulfobulbus sp.]
MAEYSPGTKKTHAGEKIANDCVFFAPPPQEIGQVATAQTTLRKNSPLPMLPLAVSYPLTIIGLALGVSLVLRYLLHGNVAINSMSFVIAVGVVALLIWKINGPLSQFFHECTYVGEKGAVRFTLTNQHKHIVKQEMLLFTQADSLYHGSTLRFEKFFYRKTDFFFVWKDQDEKVLLKIAGDYVNRSGRPKNLDHPYYFGEAAMAAWNAYLRPRIFNALEKNQVISFKAEDMIIALSKDVLMFSETSKRLVLGWGDIHSITLGGGMLEFHHQQYMRSMLFPRLWSGKGAFRGRKIRLAYDSISNVELFLAAIRDRYASWMVKKTKRRTKIK